MPFVNREHRESPDMRIPGDRTFAYYRRFKAMWKDSPRWTTFDEMAAEFCPNPMKRAGLLALLVFFHFVVADYERLKMAENGDIKG